MLIIYTLFFKRMSTAQNLKAALEKSLQHSFGNTRLGLNLVNESSKLIYDIPESTRAIFHDRRELLMSSDKSKYVPSDVIQIKIASPNDLLDCQNSYLKFDLLSSSTNDRLAGPVSQLIRKIKVYCSAGTIEELDFADVAYKLLYEAGSNINWVETHGQALGFYPGYRSEVGADRKIIRPSAGVFVRDSRWLQCKSDGTTISGTVDRLLGAQWDAANAVAGTKRTYMLPLHVSGFFSQTKLIPLQLFKDLTIEITLNSNLSAMCADDNGGTAAGAFEISTVKYIAEVVRVNDIWAAQLQLASEEKDPRMQLKMVFPSMSSQTYTSPSAGVDTTQDLTIQPNYFDVRAIYAVPRPTTCVQGDGKLNNYKTMLTDVDNAAGKLQYNWQIGQNYYPSQDVQDNLHMYAEALESFNRLKHVDNACLSYNEYLTHCFFLGLNLETDADSNLTGAPIGPSNPAILHLKSFRPTANTTWHVYCLHTRMLIIESGGKIVVNV